MSKILLCFFCIAITGSLAFSNIIDIYRKEVFNVAVLKNQQKPIVVFYTSKSCTICEKLYTKLEAMSVEQSDKMYLAKADFDKLPAETKDVFGIETIPTTRLYYKGRMLDEVKGPKWLDIRVLFADALV